MFYFGDKARKWVELTVMVIQYVKQRGNYTLIKQKAPNQRNLGLFDNVFW